MKQMLVGYVNTAQKLQMIRVEKVWEPLRIKALKITVEHPDWV